MQKIVPALWFDRHCEDAVDFYVGIFPNSKIIGLKRYPSDVQVGPVKDMAGQVLTASFELSGCRFQAMDGAPHVTINPSVSFFVNFDPSRLADARSDLDRLWERLIDGGVALMPLQEYPFSKHYGWVQDRFGVSWQLMLTNPEGEPRPAIIPSQLFVKKVCGKAEEALRLYLSVFQQGRIGSIARYPAGMAPNAEGSAMFAEAQLFDRWFAAMDSAADHRFGFNDAVSYSVECDDQAEVDCYWQGLTADGGVESQCGWLKDRYGFSWQIVPRRLHELLEDADRARANRTLKAMLTMKKIDIAGLERAADGRA